MATPAAPGHPSPSHSERAALLESLNWESRRSSVFFGLLNRAVANRLGLNVTDVEAAGVLSVLGTTTPTDLAGLLGMGTGTVTLVVDRLERAGFARRARDRKDRRSVTVEAIGERDHDIAALYAPLRQAASAILDRYSDRDLATIADYLTRSNDMLRQVSATMVDRRPSGAPDRH